MTITFNDPSAAALAENAALRGVALDERIYRAVVRVNEAAGVALDELACVAEALQYGTVQNLIDNAFREDDIGHRARQVGAALSAPDWTVKVYERGFEGIGTVQLYPVNGWWHSRFIPAGKSATYYPDVRPFESAENAMRALELWIEQGEWKVMV